LTVWDLKQQHVQSACRVLPKTTEEVSRILAITVSENCTFAIKGGGHARYADDSVSVGGVTIDMARMRSLDLSPDKGMVKLGSGHVLHSIYEGLDKYNLTTVGGRAGTVGLGGYALGGGISHLSPKYGLAMDNVFEYEVSCKSLSKDIWDAD
jgi:FAD/FMN-containing dehydrogenase